MAFCSDFRFNIQLVFCQTADDVAFLIPTAVSMFVIEFTFGQSAGKIAVPIIAVSCMMMDREQVLVLRPGAGIIVRNLNFFITRICMFVLIVAADG